MVLGTRSVMWVVPERLKCTGVNRQESKAQEGRGVGGGGKE